MIADGEMEGGQKWDRKEGKSADGLRQTGFGRKSRWVIERKERKAAVLRN